MKFHCPHCSKYSHLDQGKTPVLERAGFIQCELCKKKSFVSIRLLPSKSDARRVLTQMGVDFCDDDPKLYVKESPKEEGKGKDGKLQVDEGRSSS